jgi:hypothetical protein
MSLIDLRHLTRGGLGVGVAADLPGVGDSLIDHLWSLSTCPQRPALPGASR